MKLYIPEIGDSITLTADWSFKLRNEYRNSNIWEAFLTQHPDMDKIVLAEFEKIRDDREAESVKWFNENPGVIARWNHSWSRDYHAEENAVGYPVTLVKDTVLKVDRIYIRKGVSDYSSVTFNIIYSPDKFLTLVKDGGTVPKGTKRRFWAKLQDVNNIEFER